MTWGPLIVDVGMHRGEDTTFYLGQGHKVVAIDADPRMTELARARFAPHVGSGQLVLINAVVSDVPGSVPFHLSEKSEWSSLRKEVADREGRFKEAIVVPTLQLGDLFERYGVPHYCKIDIEGYDTVAIRSMMPGRSPRYVSCETEAAGDAAPLSEDQALESLTALRLQQYRWFKLVDQQTLRVLPLGRRVYARRSPPPLVRRFKRAIRWRGTAYYRTVVVHRHRFPYGATGPFGEALAGDWVRAEDAERLLLQHRRDYFANPGAEPHGFWCDWHAKRE